MTSSGSMARPCGAATSNNPALGTYHREQIAGKRSMTDTALQAQGRVSGSRQAKRQIVMDRAFQSATAFFALLVLVILGGVFASLVMGALPALSTFGFSFAYMQVWNPVTEK